MSFTDEPHRPDPRIRTNPAPVPEAPITVVPLKRLADEDEDDPLKGPIKSDERTLAMWAHIGGLLSGPLIPLVIWLTNKDRSRFVDEHGKEALNFQISILIYFILLCPLFPFLAVFETVVAILAAVAAHRGEPYRAPLTLRFIK